MTSPRTPASIWQKRVAHWRASGLTAHAYADQNNLSLERLRYWSARIGRETRAPQLLPVHVRPSGPATAPVELQGPSGWILRISAGADAAWLATLLQALR